MNTQEFYFGSKEFESNNIENSRFQNSWIKIYEELNSVRSIWNNYTKDNFPNIKIVIGKKNFKGYEKYFKSYSEPKGKYPISKNWIHRNSSAGYKRIERPIIIGSDGLGKLHEWKTVCQTKYPDNIIFISEEYIKTFKNYKTIFKKAKTNPYTTSGSYNYKTQFVYHLIGHILKLKDMKSCPIMNKEKSKWGIGGSRHEGLPTKKELNNRMNYYLKRKFKKKV
jgi:hypothetical protein